MAAYWTRGAVAQGSHARVDSSSRAKRWAFLEQSDDVDQRVGRLPVLYVSGVGHGDQPGAGHPFGEPPGVAGRHGAIRRTHHHHGRHRDLGQARVAILAQARRIGSSGRWSCCRNMSRPSAIIARDGCLPPMLAPISTRPVLVALDIHAPVHVLKVDKDMRQNALDIT